MAIEVRDTVGKGRGLFATKELEVGFTILCEEPYAFTLTKSQRGKRCDYTTKLSPGLKRCACCKLQWYSSVESQKAAWKEGHKEECKQLKQSGELGEEMSVMLSRIFNRIEKEHGDATDIQPSEGKFVSILGLESNYDKLNKDQQDDMGIFLARFQATKKQKFPVCLANARKLLDLCAKMKNNQFAICDEVLNSEVGSGVYLNAAMLNHSCSPNAFPIFDGKTLYVKALNKIKAGEEICIAYTDTKLTFQERQESLFSIYRFKLQKDTGKVSDAEKMKDDKGKILTQSDHAIKACLTALSDMAAFREKKEWKIMLDAVHGWMKRKILPDTNIYWLRLLEQAFDAAIENKEWAAAVEYGGRIIPGYKMYYGNEHPFLGIHLMKFGKILVEIGNGKEADEILRMSFGILSIFYPPEHQLRADLNDIILASYELTITEEEQKILDENKKEREEEAARAARHNALKKRVKKIV